jgi:hypothetical protein
VAFRVRNDGRGKLSSFKAPLPSSLRAATFPVNGEGIDFAGASA